jgi:glycosyltransferase involved in cell wall biosynthesis
MDDGRVAATLAPPAGGTRVAEPPESPTRAADARGRRIAYLSFSSGEFDARTFRMARSAIAAGYHVTVYCRWHEGLPPTEDGDGYRLIRVPWDWQLAIPILRRGAMDRARTAMAATVASARDGTPDDREDTDTDPDAGGLDGDDDAATSDATGGGPVQRVLRLPISLARRVVRRLIRPARRWWRLAKTFPLRPLGWAWALESVAEPADIWHGMWAGSLPALDRLRRKHGGRTIYDSRDVYMHSRDFAKTGPPLRDILAWFERRWARSANAVLTVNDAYADLLAEQLLVPRPPVVMNCPEAWVPPVPAPDLIREALGLGTDTKVALYQGHLMSDRGIEQAMEAILEVPGTVLALLGFGTWQDRLTEETAQPPYAGRVHLLPPVPPAELLLWTASADVMVMAIQPTTVNHHYTTPQKLFESIAAGVPVVASDLPGMAAIVRSTGVGLTVDPTSPPAIAAAIHELVDIDAADRRALRAHILGVAHTRYNWEAQLETLFDLYEALTPAR